MSSTKVKLDSLQEEITKRLADYSQDIADGIKIAAIKVGNDAVKRLQAGGPYKGGDRSGYNRGWTKKVTSSPEEISVVVHNAAVPGLTHLLEKGHAMPQGGRSKAFPHIAPAEEEAVERFKDMVEGVIRNG